MTLIPAYLGSTGHAKVHVGRDGDIVRFTLPAKTSCFHIEEPQAAADLIKLLQPLADRKPKPRKAKHLDGYEAKGAVWKLVVDPTWRYMYSAQGWLNSTDSGESWRVMRSSELKDGAPWASVTGFEEVLD